MNNKIKLSLLNYLALVLFGYGLFLLCLDVGWFFLAFLIFGFRSSYFLECATTLPLMALEPIICFLWRSVHGPFHDTKERGLLLARTITLPNMLATPINLIMECVVHSYVETSDLIDVVHHLQELRPMAFVHFAWFRIRHEPVGMNHFVEERFLEFVIASVLEKWFGECDSTRIHSLVWAGPYSLR